MKQPPNRRFFARSVATVSWPLVAVLGAGLALRLALLVVHTRSHGLAQFVQWAHVLATLGTPGLYERIEPWQAGTLDYPPGFALVLLFLERVYELWAPARDNPTLLDALLRVPPLLADIASAAICYSIVMRYAARTQAVIAAAIATFAPWTWPLSAIAGQPESICTMFSLLALDYALDERYAAAWLALGAGTFVEPYPIVVAPLLLAVQARNEGVSLRLLAGPFIGCAIGYVLALPFAPSAIPLETVSWFEHVYRIARGLPVTSIDAANAWFAFAQPMLDTHIVFGLTLQTYGWLAFAVLEFFVIVVTLGRMTQANSRLAVARVLVPAWFTVMLALFVVTTRMHASYLAYALAVAPAIWPIGIWERRSVAMLTATYSASAIVPIWLPPEASELVLLVLRAIALTNVATLAYVLVRFAAPPPKAVEDWGALRVP